MRAPRRTLDEQTNQSRPGLLVVLNFSDVKQRPRLLDWRQSELRRQLDRPRARSAIAIGMGKRPYKQTAKGGSMVSFTLNNRQVSVDADPRTPLLWAIRDHVGLTGTKYGCGAGLCGACTIHIDGVAQRSCQLDVGSVAGKTVVTIEGLSPTSSHPLQKAWVVEEVPQCGYCQSGQIMKAAELLAKNPKPSRADIITHMNGNICRCGTYHRIIAAIERAAKES